MSEKKCSRCGLIKPLMDFKSWTDKKTGIIKYRSECKACNKEYEKTYNHKYYEAVTVEKRKKMQIDKSKCLSCGQCVDVCPLWKLYR